MLLMVAGALLFGFYTYLPNPAEVTEHLTDNATRVQIAGYVGVVAAFFMLWFAGSAKTLLRSREGANGRLTAIAFGGTVSAGTGLALVFGLMTAAGARAGADSGISDIAAVTLYDAYASLFTVAVGVGLAALVGAFSIAGLRGEFLPRWAGWLGVVVAVGTVSPLAYLFVGPVAVYVLVLSLWGYRTGSRTATL